MKIHKLILPVMLVSAAVGTAMVREAMMEGALDKQMVAQSPVALLYAQPFELEQPFAYEMRADRPSVRAGYLVVVNTNPAILPVRQIHNALLFAGDLPVERINGDAESRVFIGFVPSKVSERGTLELDLGKTPLYWSYPEVLPESLTSDRAGAELAKALAGGALPQAKTHVDAALKAGGELVHLGTYGDLRRHAANVIEQFSPGEVDLVAGLRVPMVGK